MGTLDFIASLVGSLAWPGTVITSSFLFRKQIAERLSTIKRVQWGNKTVDFDLELDQVEKTAVEVLPPAEGMQALPPTSVEESDTQRIESARFETTLEVAPRLAVLDAWLPIENELQRLAVEKGYDSRARSPTFLVRRLHLDGLLDRQTVKLIDDLRTLRNHAVHRVDDGEVTAEDARRYRELAEAVSAKLRALA